MIKTVASMQLPINEKLVVQKNRILPLEASVGEKRIAIVTGIHGDELEGQFVCYELLRRIKEHPENVKGIIDIYPALNPLGIDSIERGIPKFDIDMNRMFPGDANGSMVEMLVKEIVDDLSDADMCIDIHASNIFLMEMPQVRVSDEMSEKLMPYAKLLNADFVWVHSSATVLESTLAYSLNNINVPTLAVEMGVGMRITKDYGNQITDGIFNVMKAMDIWDGEVSEAKEAVVSYDREIGQISAKEAGVYLPMVNIGDYVKKGDVFGKITNPLTGEDVETLYAPIDGMVFTRREYPIVIDGSLIGRVLGG